MPAHAPSFLHTCRRLQSNQTCRGKAAAEEGGSDEDVMVVDGVEEEEEMEEGFGGGDDDELEVHEILGGREGGRGAAPPHGGQEAPSVSGELGATTAPSHPPTPTLHVQVVGHTGANAMSDYPHSRHTCVRFPFSSSHDKETNKK